MGEGTRRALQANDPFRPRGGPPDRNGLNASHPGRLFACRAEHPVPNCSILHALTGPDPSLVVLEKCLGGAQGPGDRLLPGRPARTPICRLAPSPKACSILQTRGRVMVRNVRRLLRGQGITQTLPRRAIEYAHCFTCCSAVFFFVDPRAESLPGAQNPTHGLRGAPLGLTSRSAPRRPLI